MAAILDERDAWRRVLGGRNSVKERNSVC
jgi:hypothetical protein